MRNSVWSKIILGAILLATLLVNLPVWNQPFGRDQGIFAYIGEGILNGFVPFRDSWDHKPPGIDFLYALGFAIFGHQMPSIHIVETLSILATVLTVYFLGKQLISRKVGLVAALVYGMASTLMFEWWDRGQAEVFMSLPLGLSFAIFLHATGPFLRQPDTEGSKTEVEEIQLISISEPFFLVPLSIREAILILSSGFIAGLTLYLKPTGGSQLAFLAVIPVCILGTHIWESGRSSLKSQLFPVLRQFIFIWLLLAIGCVLSLVPGAIYFGVNGTLTDLYETVVVFNMDHIKEGANLTLASMVLNSLDFGRRMGVVSPLAIAGIVLLAIRRRGLAALLISLWAIAVLSGIWAQGKFFSYHWSPMVPPLSLLCGYTIVIIWTEAKSLLRSLSLHTEKAYASFVLVSFLLVYVFSFDNDVQPKMARDLDYLLGKTSEEEYLSNFAHNINGTDIYSFPAAKETADYLKQRTTKDDKVLVWGFQALVNYLADRRAPTRFVFSYPLTIEQSDSAFKEQARLTFQKEFNTNKPKYVVLVSNDVNPIQTLDSQTLLSTFPEFKEQLDSQYKLERDIADFHIYVSKTP